MCTHEESRHGAKLFHLWLKALHKKKLCWCISKSTSTENTFEEVFYSVKYLRAMLLITYLFLCVYDCTDSTRTNMNEWIHEELRVMCYIPHQRAKYCCFRKKKKKHCVFQAHFCGARDWFNGMKHKSQCISARGKILSFFTKIWFDLCQYQQLCVLTVSLQHCREQNSSAKQPHKNMLISDSHVCHVSPPLLYLSTQSVIRGK